MQGCLDEIHRCEVIDFLISRPESDEDVTAAILPGEVVLLSFWAAWCGPCMAEIPHEVSIAEMYRERPFAIVGVNADTNRQEIKPALIERKISWQSFWCGDAGPDGAIPRAWNITSWPTTYLIDESGTIRGKHLSDATLEKTIAELVAEAESLVK